MALAWLVSPQKQFMTRSGTINAAGYLRVFDAATDDTVVTYSNFSGGENPELVQFDSDGRANVIADDSRAYRIEVYDRYGSLLWTASPVWCMTTGGGVTATQVISSDRSVAITRTAVGGTVQFDLSTRVGDSTDLLEWISCSGDSEFHDGAFHLEYNAGTMETGERGIRLYARRYYHVTAEVAAGKDGVNPVYDNVDFVLYFRNGEGDLEEVAKFSRVGDYSMGLSQCWTVACDCMPETDVELVLRVEGKDLEDGGGFTVTRFDVHRVFSGAPALPGGAVSKDMLDDGLAGKQDTLTAGTGITIEGNVISATAAQQQQADWSQTDTGAVDFIKNKPDLSDFVTESDMQSALADKQDTLTPGTGITIQDNVISATAAQQQQADWDQSDSSAIDFIKNKPELSEFVTDSDMETALSGKQDTLTAGDNITISGNTISASAAPQEQADWSQTDSGAVDFIKNKPTIPTFTSDQQAAIDSGINSTKVGTYDTHVVDTTIHVTSTDKTNWNAKEDASNKKQSIDDSSTTDFPSSKAVADFVNSSVATATARFLGSFTLTDLGLTYGATNVQIATALDNHTWPSGTSPTNNDYVYVEIQDPQTTAIDDEVRRFKFNGTVWAYEYTLNNSSFTAAEKAAIDSGITSTLVTSYSGHVADSTIHVTSTDKTTWNAKQDAINDLSDIRSGASAGATAVQPGDLAAVATSGSYNDLLNKPTIPAAQVQADWDQENTGAVDFVKNKPTIPVVDQTYGASSTNAQSGTAVADAISGVRQVPSTQSTDNGKVLGVTDANGTLGWVAQSGGGGTVDQTYNASSTNAQSGTAVAGAIATVRQVPSTQSTDNGKVLGVTDANGTLGWVAQGGGGGGGTQVQTDWDETDTASPAYLLNKPGERSLTAGNCIGVSISGSNLVVDFMTTAGITDIQVVTDLPANPVSTVLYLIPESTP